MWWFYRTAESPFKRLSPPIRKKERGNPDVTLPDSPAPFPRMRSGLVGLHRHRYRLRRDLLLGLLCGRRLPASGKIARLSRSSTVSVPQ